MDAVVELKAALAKLVRSMFPGVFAATGTIRARVTKVHEAGGKMTSLEPRYSVDVQPLGRDGQEHPDMPEIPDVELSMLWAGPGLGVYCLPAKGAIVRVGFYYNDPNMPYVESVVGEGFEAPDHPQGKFIIVAGDARLEIDSSMIIIQSGKIHLKADVDVEGDVGAGGDVSAAGGAFGLGTFPVMVQGPTGPQPAMSLKAS